MARLRTTVLLCLCLATALSGVAQAADIERPARFLPRMDRQLVQATNPVDGSTWAAWTYRNGAETDIAISRLEAGVWSEPQLLGLSDNESQQQPALAVDGYGTTYLVYSERGTGQVFVTARGLGARDWTNPSAVTPAGARAGFPAVLIAADRRLVVGYVSDGRAAMRQYSLMPPVTVSGNDGPDPLGQTSWPPESEDDGTDDRAVSDSEGAYQELGDRGPNRRGWQY